MKKISPIKIIAINFIVFAILIVIIVAFNLMSVLPTTTIIDCDSMDPNYCDTNDDCICSMNKCFRGNKEYSDYCVQEAEVCSLNFCFFAPEEGMICVDHKCQIG